MSSPTDVPAPLGGTAPEWKQVDTLIDEQKMDAARALVRQIRSTARAHGREGDWTQSLVREAQLDIALSGVETAVRFLDGEPWPTGALAHTVLDLYRAQTLLAYLDAYSYEIGQREKVESKGAVDLKAWTGPQIVAEAERSLAAVWARRSDFGERGADSLAPYLTAGTYPPHIRDTLRDALTYLAVAHFADASRWRPEQSAELYRLDFKALVAGASPPTAVKLDDPALHPLVKVGALLDDLESWHAHGGRREAALEARLERVRRLREAFTAATERRALRADLEARLLAARGVPWWSMGMELVAEMVRGDAGDLVRARAVADEAHRAYPQSPGGQRCLRIVKEIESQDFQLAAMALDGAGKRSIEVTHRNLRKLHFRAYAVDLFQRIEAADDYNLLPAYDQLRKLLADATPVATFDVDLPPTPDYRPHRTFVTPRLPGRGLFVVLASAAPDFREHDNRVLGVNLVVSDLVLAARTLPDGAVLAQVMSGATGKVLPGVEVILYRFEWGKRHARIASRPTDARGEVTFAAVAERGACFVVARHGDDVSVDPNQLYGYRGREPGVQKASLVYTDRSIYRPLQPLYWKVVAYHGNSAEARFSVESGASVKVTLLDPNGQEVESRTVRTNDHGSAAGEFAIPTGRLLGQWQLRTSYGGAAEVRVEEYKRPTFEVTIRDPVAPMRLNQPAHLVGEARYYFGLPVATGAVKWRVAREPVYPWWWWWFGGSSREGSQTVASGTAPVAADGTFTMTFTPAADERRAQARDVTYRYALDADLTDEGGETRSASRSFRLGFVSVEAALSTEVGFVRTGERAEVTIARTSLDGVPRPGKGSYRLIAVRAPKQALLPSELPLLHAPGGDDPADASSYRTPGDALRPRWDAGSAPEATMGAWPDGEVRAHGDVTHDDKGLAHVVLPELAPGVYRLRYETLDDFGAKFESWKDVVVTARGAGGHAGGAARAPAIPIAALLVAESPSVKVGSVARLLAATGLPGEEMYYEVFRAGRRVDWRKLDGTTLIEVPVTEADRGGFGVTLTVVRDHQRIQLSRTVMVPWDDRALTLEFASFRDRIRPGAKETWRITVKGPPGAAAADVRTAELLAYMYDRSLDAFAPHNPPSVAGLLPARTQVAWSRSNLGPSAAQWLFNEELDRLPPTPSFEPAQLVFLDAYGVGGMGLRRFRAGGRVGGGGAPMAMAAAPPPAAPGAPAPARAAKAAARAEASVDGDEMEKKVEAPAGSPREPASSKAGAVEVRSNFAETAFWRPSLITDGRGSATIEFTVPDSVTSWNVWVHAVTRELRGGSLHKETRSVKDLMVRPYLPRFFREGDRAELKVVVDNASDHPLTGTLDFDVVDPETKKSLAASFAIEHRQKPFTVEAGKGVSLTFPVVAPRRVGVVAFLATARAGDVSDGELRPLPVLPGRMHLAQSRFVTLRDADRRSMTFPDLASSTDPTRVNESMVVTVDAQLFYTVLKALPYLVDYPYECTEQTLNRFVSTGIVSSLYRDYPAVARMAQELSSRPTQLETFDAADPNRRMALEESPWLNEAAGRTGPVEPGLIKVLDPKVARAQRDEAIAKLAKAQTASGAFPWFPGGPPSPYMTLYLMHGLARAAEFHVDVPKEMIQRGWQYLARHYRDEYAAHVRKGDASWQFLTFLGYVASSYPDASYTGDALSLDERRQMLAYSFAHWKQHSPYLKGQLALTLARMGRLADGKLVFASVMDSARTAPDQGTFWAQEDRSWLWYNDTIESHAFALRVLMELDPANAKKDGLVLWLLLNKKLNQWKSTRATAEVIYSLIHYLQAQGALGVREDATVSVGPERRTFTFDPEHYEGRRQVVVPGEALDPRTSSTVTVEKQSKGVVFASATWHFSTEKLPDADRGDFFQVSRHYFRRTPGPGGFTLAPLAEGAVLAPGDEVEVQLSLRSKHEAEYVHLRDPRAAGLEPATGAVSRWKWDLGIAWYEETRDSGTNFFFERLPVGEYTFRYRLRANLAGTFRVGPATVQSLYAPEFNAYSAGHVVTVGGAK